MSNGQDKGNLHRSGLIGKAGEALVAAELLRRGLDVAYPALDTGVDLFAYRQSNPQCMVPIQVKTWSGDGFTFHRSWFLRVPGVVLVQVFDAATAPRFYVFGNLEDVKAALGQDSVSSSAWQDGGKFSASPPLSKARADRMIPHLDRWDRITDQLKETR